MGALLDLPALLARLAATRPVFASEADFQLALAWEIHVAHPDARIRLEYRPAYLDRRGYLDIWVAASTWSVAIELKYWTRALDVTVGEEHFELLNQGAQDISRYDFIKDLVRVESIVKAQPDTTGAVVALTNDASYWRLPTPGRSTIDEAFRLHEGQTLSGSRAWGPNAGPGTTRGRVGALPLVGAFDLGWRPYSNLGPGPNQTFNYLLVDVASGDASAER